MERSTTHLARKRHDRPVEETSHVWHQVDNRTAIIEDGTEPGLLGVLARVALRDGVQRFRRRRVRCRVGQYDGDSGPSALCTAEQTTNLRG
jgi:hypothetical protein